MYGTHSVIKLGLFKIYLYFFLRGARVGEMGGGEQVDVLLAYPAKEGVTAILCLCFDSGPSTKCPGIWDMYSTVVMCTH